MKTIASTKCFCKYLKCFLGVVRVCRMIIIYRAGTRNGYGTGVLAISPEIFKFVSSVAGVGLQDLANRANQMSVSN